MSVSRVRTVTTEPWAPETICHIGGAVDPVT